ncbi:hypothetical protein FKM82_002675 [Ascaphus truei]
MEEVPQGTFEDELEWCISQLEIGLLRLNPTQKQVSETQHALLVLRSRKSPFVKKRQMMNQVFGNYRLKMAEERRVQERAASSSTEARIQEGAAQDSGSVSYKKCSKDMPSRSGHWFNTSDNSFCFDFCPGDMDQGKEGRCGDAEREPAEPLKTRDFQDGAQGSIMGSAEEVSGFTFDFQIREEEAFSPQNSEVKGQESGQEISCEPPSTGYSSPEVEGEVKSQSHGDTKAVKNNTESGATAKQSLNPGATAKNPGDAPRKKKKGSQQKSPAGPAGISAPPQEEPQTGADDLQRELDWCVEQLEFGLHRQKSTPKQAEEALRAIKTLRSQKAALVKKRQVMRAMLGDYRRKMEEEKQRQLRQMQTAARSARVSEVAVGARRKSSKVYRQCIQKSRRHMGQSRVTPASSTVSATLAVAPGTSSPEEFVFSSSPQPFCFNFF